MNGIAIDIQSIHNSGVVVFEMDRFILSSELIEFRNKLVLGID